MSTTLPLGLYRADHVGSLLRPATLKTARADFAAGKISTEALVQVEDAEITACVKGQLACGLRSITDGEFRRAYFHIDFLKQVNGVEVIKEKSASTGGATAAKDGFSPPKLIVTGKLEHGKDIQVADFQFLRDTLRSALAQTGANGATLPATAKVCIPSPTMVHFRGGRASIDIDAYPTLEPHFFDDLAKVYQEELAALYDAGARFVQFDDTNLAYLCDENMRAAARERNDDPDLLPKRYAVCLSLH
jgi:5-methyltetrahydropteroyltriglutamate--homocysteine methyltransferase